MVRTMLIWVCAATAGAAQTQDPSTPSAPALCSAPVAIHSTVLPGNITPSGQAVVKLDWVGARLHLKPGATPPEYPEEACRQGIRGRVVLDVAAAPDGVVRVVTPVKGSRVFVDAAARAVRSWQFETVYRLGSPAMLATRIEFLFGMGE